MRTAARTFVALIHLGTAGMMGSTSAHAQTVLGTIALKSGESTELGDFVLGHKLSVPSEKYA
jgi:hypothetical protein